MKQKRTKMFIAKNLALYSETLELFWNIESNRTQKKNIEILKKFDSVRSK